MTREQKIRILKRRIIRKTTNVILGLSACALFSVGFIMAAKFDYMDNFCDYHKAEVVYVNQTLVQFQTKDGYFWEIYDDNYKVGDKVTLIIDNNGTETLEDDVIVDVEMRR